MKEKTNVGARKPLVAVLSTVRLSSQDGLPTGKEARVLEEQFSMAKRYGISMFIFHWDGVSWLKRSIKGYTYIFGVEKTGHWVRKTFAFPDVVYNRIRSRKIENLSAVKQLLNKFDHDPDIHLFNSRFLDKWEVYEALANNPLTSGMVPPTRLLSSVDLEGFLDTHSEVFIKPRNNNAGRGIIKVVRKSSNIYFCHAESASSQWHTCSSFSDLYKQLRSVIQKPGNYMVQTGIDLAKLDGRVFDTRAQVQKNGNGQWVFTGITVRVATRNRFVTYDKYSLNKSVSFTKAIAKVTRGAEATKASINTQLQDLFNLVPRVLEKDLDLSLAVLSIDIGIDSHGKVWIIEVSSKSDSFTEKYIKAKHLRYLMEYFIYISRNNPQKPPNY